MRSQVATQSSYYSSIDSDHHQTDHENTTILRVVAAFGAALTTLWQLVREMDLLIWIPLYGIGGFHVFLVRTHSQVSDKGLDLIMGFVKVAYNEATNVIIMAT